MAYDGFDIQITTNVTDNTGNALTATGLTIPAFDKLIKLIRLQGGNKVDGIYLSYGLQNVVNQIVSGQARYFVQPDSSKNVFTAGDNVTTYMSTLGPVPVVGDFFCNPALPLMDSGSKIFSNQWGNSQIETTLSKQISFLIVQLQRLNEKSLFTSNKMHYKIDMRQSELYGDIERYTEMIYL